MGGSYLNQESYAIGNELDRLNGRLNFKHTFSDKLRFGANIGISRVDNDQNRWRKQYVLSINFQLSTIALRRMPLMMMEVLRNTLVLLET